uniref:Potassium voltage-gated channel subfamily E regulatory subunit 5 n=1 Tax=Salvator merianae TaxID=96440 RepID=A0A8D0C878_SALMN
MNCSESQRRLQRLLMQLWQEVLRGDEPGGAPSNCSGRRPAAALGPCWAEGEASPSAGSKGVADDAYLYILLIMIFYGCLAGGLILAYTRSRKLESKHDPYHLYIESDWTGRPSNGRGDNAKATLRELNLDEAAAAAIGGERRHSGDGEPL